MSLQRKSLLSSHMRCMTTASLRAKATLARFKRRVLASRVAQAAVMYFGQFCEIGPTEALFAVALPPLHGGFAVRRAHSRPLAGEDQHSLVGHRSERARSALRLQVPYTLPTQDRPYMRARVPPVARYNGGTPNLLSHRHRRTARRGTSSQSCVGSSQQLRIFPSSKQMGELGCFRNGGPGSALARRAPCCHDGVYKQLRVVQAAGR